MAEDGIYVYAISRDLAPEATKGVTGIGGRPVRILEHGGLRAVVSAVSLAEFGEEALRRNLEDLGWLEATARAHHAVVDASAGSAAVVPLGLATVYRGEDRVRRALNARSADFTRALDRITGRTEWGVKGYAEARPAAPAPAEKPPSASPGTSYLRRRRMQQETEERARSEVMDIAERVHAELCGIAAAARLHRPQNPELSGERGRMILNAAYLVDDSRSGDFQATVHRLGERWPDVRLRLTGPWAPYSFATEETAWTEP